ncbi:hypothetical protein BDQ17DRAFT_1418651 [Cyathus striatus]|nr:hypothetical protein BDQ17DRAFT_1418651 [Cyathus striatus]
MLHTPPRAWGTRFDTLPTSPSSPSSPSLRGLPSPSRSLPVPSHHPNQSPSSTSTIDRHPHDASVFVGSLPTTVDLDHLTRLLGDHLSDYAQVKNIKVVRDSKGGVCAFVQCEDAVAAAKLIDTLNHTDQKTFFGRILRYEPARAFRSLLLSFRTPFESRSSTDTARDDPRQAEGISFELDLPFAMRLCKKPNSRFYNISYNDDAIEAERRAKSEQEDSNKLFLHPVVFDKKSLYEIATFFGRLEKFCPLDIPSCPEENTTERTGDRLWSRYPPPHNALRSPNMNKSCWEVKWEHRDDCLSALNTLRRVPHITATWAHQPTHFNLTHRPPSVYHASSLHYMHNYPNRPHTFLGKTPLKCGYYSSREGGIRNELESESCQASRDKLGGPTPLTRVDWSESDFPPLGIIYHHKSQNALLSKELQDNDQTFTSPFQARGKSPSVPSSSDLSHSPRRVSSISIDREPSVTDSSGLENSLSPVPTADPEVDPTTLFVGGLEMYGPGAWDENRLRHIFSKYKGLVNVQLVKPVNSPVAFAFVKFDNDEDLRVLWPRNIIRSMMAVLCAFNLGIVTLEALGNMDEDGLRLDSIVIPIPHRSHASVTWKLSKYHPHPKRRFQ